MELKEGMYIRYVPTLGKYTQKISKITKTKNCMLDMCYTLDDKEEVFSSHFDEIIKASHNIIDLIEVGDYVNGSKVIEIEKDYKFIDNEIRDILWLDNKRNNAVWKETIKSIVTKEQFSQISYNLPKDK